VVAALRSRGRSLIGLWLRGAARSTPAVLAISLATLVPLVLLAAAGAVWLGGSVSLGRVTGVGGLAFLTFSRVPIAVALERGSGTVGGFQAVASVALLGGTAAVAWGLWWAARRGAVRAGRGPASGATSGLAHAVAGAGVAVPWVAVNVAVVLVLRWRELSVPVPLLGALTARPSIAGTIVWPTVLALAVGTASGLRAAEPRRRWLPSGVAPGGLTALSAGLALAFAGLLVWAAVDHSATSAYLRVAFGGGVGRALAVLGGTILALPSLAVWTLSGAMGACVGVAGTAEACRVSYQAFPLGDLGALSQPAPLGLVAFLVVPLLATVVGGMVAARRSNAVDRRGAIAVGAAAGLVFAAATTVLAAWSTLVLEVSGSQGSASTYRVGPFLVQTALLAVAWGVAGGAAGGWAYGPPSPPRSADPGAGPDDGERLDAGPGEGEPGAEHGERGGERGLGQRRRPELAEDGPQPGDDGQNGDHRRLDPGVAGADEGPDGEGEAERG
jgi:hypothetical protein